jgi:hypothetical protein
MDSLQEKDLGSPGPPVVGLTQKGDIMKNYSNSVFHFTDRRGILGILQNNFKPHYCKERNTENNIDFDYWVPLVCFCDIPLSQIGNHISEYGKYGLGLSREWTLRSKLNPVLYYHEKSDLYSLYMKLSKSLSDIANETSENKYNESNPYDSFCISKDLFAYFKPYYGYDFKLKDNKVFYSEREWRYISKNTVSGNVIIPDSIENRDAIISNGNYILDSEVLFFEPKDVTFIILQNENE